jgi:hypothetical protein
MYCHVRMVVGGMRRYYGQVWKESWDSCGLNEKCVDVGILDYSGDWLLPIRRADVYQPPIKILCTLVCDIRSP